MAACILGIQQAKRRGQELYREMGAPTENDIVRIFGVPPSDLDLAPVTLQGEDMTSVQVYLVYLDGIPESQLASMRRLKLSCAVKVLHDENYLTPETQVMGDQGSLWLNFLGGSMMSKRSDFMKDKTKKKTKIPPTWEKLVARSRELLATRRQTIASKYEASKAAEEDAEPDAQDSESDSGHGFGDEEEARKPRPVEIIQDPNACMQASLGLDGGGEKKSSKTASSKREPKPKGKGKKKGRKPLRDDDSESEQRCLEAGEAQNFENDDAMREVAERHELITGKSAVCFSNLQVVRFLNNEKLGQSLSGVA